MPKTFTLTLTKPGQEAPRLQLNLEKGDTFFVEIYWNCHADHQDDMDIAALETVGGLIDSLDDIISTYNTTRMSRTGVLKTGPKGEFQSPSGGIMHSGDVRIQGSFERITINGSRLVVDTDEIPFIATVHKIDEEHHGGGHDEEGEEAAFADIEECYVVIKNGSGKELAKYILSKEFGEFNVVQLGALMLGPTGWEFAAVGRGFVGDFNDVLANFS